MNLFIDFIDPNCCYWFKSLQMWQWEMQTTLQRDLRFVNPLGLEGVCCAGAVGFTLYLLPQASEKQVHFVVSRQTRQQTPDILQETGWSYGGPQPCPTERSNPGKVRARALARFLCRPWDRGLGGRLAIYCQWKHKSCPHYSHAASGLTPSGVGRAGEGEGQRWG